MVVHVALCKWREDTTESTITDIAYLFKKLSSIPGIYVAQMTRNESKYSEGYTRVVYVVGEKQSTIDAYRAHPVHTKIATAIDTIEDHGIGVDFSY